MTIIDGATALDFPHFLPEPHESGKHITDLRATRMWHDILYTHRATRMWHISAPHMQFILPRHPNVAPRFATKGTRYHSDVVTKLHECGTRTPPECGSLGPPERGPTRTWTTTRWPSDFMSLQVPWVPIPGREDTMPPGKTVTTHQPQPQHC